MARPSRRAHGSERLARGESAALPQEQEVRSVLAIRSFRRLWISLSLSSLGDWLGFLATTALATQLVTGYSEKLYAIAGVLFVRLLPALFFGPLAGAFADRFNRRRTMVVTDVIRFGLYLTIPLELHLVWLIVATFLIEINSLFWIPAKEASIPNLVPRSKLEQANQLNLVTTYGFGAVAAGVFSLLALLNRGLAHEVSFFRTNPVNLALYLDAATFLISALTILNLRELDHKRVTTRPEDEAEEQLGLFQSVVEGFRFLREQAWLRGLVLGISGATAAGAAVIGLSARFAADLKGGDAAYGVLFGTIFVGLAAGMLLGPRAIGSLSRDRAVGMSIVGAGVTLALLAIIPNLALAVVLTGLLGFWAGLVWVVALTLVGGRVSDDLRGRTFAFIYNLMRLVLLAMVALAPVIAGQIGPHFISVGHSYIRLDGVTLTMFGAGVLAVVIGIVCYRLMDERPDISLRADVSAALLRRSPLHGRGTAEGLFVAFEGGEGAGKSTQVAWLARTLRGMGYDVVTTFEPGATPIGAKIRALLLDPDSRMSPMVEAMLYAADRAEHVASVIRPALERGAIVLTDRYIDSSLAYQAGGRELSEPEIRRLSAQATGGLTPDLTVLLDIDPRVGLTRRDGPLDRLESESLEFHDRVRRAFLALPHRGLFVRLDAARTPEEVQADLLVEISDLLPVAVLPERVDEVVGTVPSPHTA